MGLTGAPWLINIKTQWTIRSTGVAVLVAYSEKLMNCSVSTFICTDMWLLQLIVTCFSGSICFQVPVDNLLQWDIGLLASLLIAS